MAKASSPKRLAMNIARIVISVGLIAYLLTRIDLQSLSDSIRSAHLWMLLAAIPLQWLSWSIAATRWHALLVAVGWRISLPRAWLITQTSRFYGFLTPGQIGSEVIRWARLSAKRGDRSVDVALSLVFDRLIGFTALILFAVAAMLTYQSDLVTPTARAAIWCLLIGTLAFMGFIVIRVEQFLPARWQERGAEILQRVQSRGRLLAQLVDAIRAYRGKFAALLAALILSSLYHILNIATNQLIAASLDLRVSFLQMTVLYAVVTVLVMLPVSIAGIGVREVTYAQLLTDMGFNGPAVIAMPLLAFALAATATVLLGGILELPDAMRQLFFGDSGEETSGE